MISQLNLAFHYLSGRKLRTALTTLAIVFGVMVIFAMDGMIPAFQESIKNTVMMTSNQVDMSVTSQSHGTFDEAELNNILQTQGVDRAAGLLARNVLMPQTMSLKTREGSYIDTLRIVGIIPGDYYKVRKIDVSSGKELDINDYHGAMISENLSMKTGIKAGDVIRAPSASGTMELNVTGIYKGKPSLGPEEVMVLLKNAQEIFNLNGKINAVEIMYSAGINSEKVRGDILGRLGAGFTAGGNETRDGIFASIETGRKMLAFVGFIALAMGGFIIFITFRTIVAERKRDIGLLRSIGATRGKIIKLILVEGILQGFAGTLAGLCAGYALVKLILAVMAPVMEKMVRIHLNGPVFSLKSYILAGVLGIGVTLVGGLFPAISAGRVSPLEALRPSSGAYVKGSLKGRIIVGVVLIALSVSGLTARNSGIAFLGLLLFVAGLITVGPALVKPVTEIFGNIIDLVFKREGKIARGNLENHPRRASLTAVTMMIGLALLIAVAGAMTSLFSGMFEYLDKSLGSDYLLMPQSLFLEGGNVGAGSGLVKSLKEVDGVAEATGLRVSMTKADGTYMQIIGIDPDVYPDISGLVFSSGDPDDAFGKLKSGRNIILNGIFASTNNKKVGDILKINTPEGIKEYTVVGIGVDYMNAKLSTGYISQENIEKDFKEKTDILIMVNRIKSTDDVKVRGALQEKIKNYPAFTLFSADEFKQSQRKAFDSSLSLIFILMIALVIPSLISLVNTIGIGVLERTREIGVMRAIGATGRQVRRIIIAESVLLAGIGALFGIICGIWLGYILVEATNMIGFKVSYYFPYIGILIAIAVGLIFGIIGALIPAGHAAKLNVVDALKFE